MYGTDNQVPYICSTVDRPLTVPDPFVFPQARSPFSVNMNRRSMARPLLSLIAFPFRIPSIIAMEAVVAVSRVMDHAFSTKSDRIIARMRRVRVQTYFQ